MKYSDDLQNRLFEVLLAKGPDYFPRTKHIKNNQPVFTNRLILEDSPYLLQHAHNPVNWYPWGEEAFATAVAEDKPIFLSIGYATCHWCHVMEEESFESTRVADVLNQNYISIKVDREQYPDIDHAYMTAVTMLAGQGGWPMSSFLTPEGRPFYGGTYFPQLNFIDLLQKISRLWHDQRQNLMDQADQLADAVIKANITRDQINEISSGSVQAAVDAILVSYDRQNGGFSPPPKFPNEPLLMLLLQTVQKQPQDKVLKPLNHTLYAMIQGGIYDQVGGGFHRYATDPEWLVPHFEKMLYNQAYLARIYTQAYGLTGKDLYALTVRQTLDYVLRDMVSKEGVFYSATDADSEGHEGTYFIWTEEEIRNLLEPVDADFMIKLYGVSSRGNFEGKNILFFPEPMDEIAALLQVSLNSLINRTAPLLEILRNYREKRKPPLTDDKIIVSWNGMLITALAEAGKLLNRSEYINAAVRAMDHLLKTQRPEQGVLWRVNLAGKISIPARQDDYAHLIEALLALYDVADHPEYLKHARSLANEMLDKFADHSSGALMMGQDPLLFVSPKDTYDGALPSGNAVAIRVLSRLSRRTGDSGYMDNAEKILQAFSSSINNQPIAYSYMLAQMEELRHGEAGAIQYAAQGAVKAEAFLLKQNDGFGLEIRLEIADGWHINAPDSVEEHLSGMAITVEENPYWELNTINYPEPGLVQTNFEKNEIKLFQGQVLIKAIVSERREHSHAPIPLRIQIQSCSHEACLPPEKIRLMVNYPWN